VWLLALACTDKPTSTADCEVLLFRDDDGDGWGVEEAWARACPEAGWVEEPGDCDDLDETEHPAAESPCDCALSDATRVWFEDLDGDAWGAGEGLEVCQGPAGWVLQDGDCAPDDPSISPGDAEVWYDGVDQDCSGGSDYDADSDGHDHEDWGGDDCDDDNASVHPDAKEICDAERLDEDCDGLANEDDPDARDFRTWYPDADGDGHGVPGDTVVACSPPEGYAGDDQDCDDDNAEVSPSAEEVCGNGVDEDCLSDSFICGATGQASLSWSEQIWVSEVSQGQPSDLAVGDLDGDGVAELIAGDPWFEYVGGSTRPAVLIAELGEEVAEDGQVLEAELDSASAYSVGAGDVDGDGVDDLLVGEVASNGAVNLLFGPVTAGTVAEGTDLRMEGRIGASTGGFALYADIVADVDGDGMLDVLVSDPYSSWNAANQGESHLFSTAGSGTTDVYDAFATVGGENAYDKVTHGVVADLDGDGLPEWTVYAPEATRTTTGSGAIWVLDVGAGGSFVTSDGVELSGSGYRAYLGWSVAAADLDGDGYRGLLVGEPAWSNSSSSDGRVHVLTERPTEDGRAIDQATAVLYGDTYNEYAGRAIVATGDVTGDGLEDAAVAGYAGSVTESYQGRTYLISGPVTGHHNLDLVARAELLGETRYGYAGRLLAAGDVDGDGLGDVLIAGQDGVHTWGAVYLVPGGPGE